MADVSIRRPGPSDWPEILSVLKTANFHHIGSPEMERFPLEDCFVATVGGTVRGVGGYRVLTPTTAKTTLLAVDPAFARYRLGALLQDARLAWLREQGIESVTTNTDDPRVMAWIQRVYGFRPTGGTVPKEADFGDPRVDHWTTFRLDFRR